MSAEQPVDTAAGPSAGSEEASYVGVLAGVPAKKMAKLEARLKAVPDLSSEDEEMDDPDISGSDSFSDPEYLPGVDDGDDDSDSSEDEVFHTPPEWALLLDFQQISEAVGGAGGSPEHLPAATFRALVDSASRPCRVSVENVGPVLPPVLVRVLGQYLQLTGCILCYLSSQPDLICL